MAGPLDDLGGLAGLLGGNNELLTLYRELEALQGKNDPFSASKRQGIENRIARLSSPTGGAGRTAAQEALTEAQTAEIWNRLGGEPMSDYLDRLSIAIEHGDLRRAEARDIWQREVDRARLEQDAPLKAAQTLSQLGGGFVPSGATQIAGTGPGGNLQKAYDLDPADFTIEARPFEPFVEAFRPQLPSNQQVQQQAQANVPDMTALAQAAAAAQGGR